MLCRKKNQDVQRGIKMGSDGAFRVDVSRFSDPQQPSKQTSPRQLEICGQLNKYLYNNVIIL